MSAEGMIVLVQVDVDSGTIQSSRLVQESSEFTLAFSIDDLPGQSALVLLDKPTSSVLLFDLRTGNFALLACLGQETCPTDIVLADFVEASLHFDETRSTWGGMSITISELPYDRSMLSTFEDNTFVYIVADTTGDGEIDLRFQPIR